MATAFATTFVRPGEMRQMRVLGAVRGRQLASRQQAARPAAAPLVVRAAAVESKAAAFARHESDCGSPEVQIADLSARVLQLTEHLQQHRKDFSTRRGLMKILSQRKQLMLYLQRTNRSKYDEVIQALGIRPLKTGA